ncbi:metal ABC transporter permease, partial [bacterium]|nr:metal ABC transporter permease [bacterium]
IRAVGILLISALIVIPALIGLNLGKSFKSSIIIACIASVIGIYLGIFTSYIFDIPTGGTIVMSIIFLFVISLFFKK